MRLKRLSDNFITVCGVGLGSAVVDFHPSRLGWLVFMAFVVAVVCRAFARSGP